MAKIAKTTKFVRKKVHKKITGTKLILSKEKVGQFYRLCQLVQELKGVL